MPLSLEMTTIFIKLDIWAIYMKEVYMNFIYWLDRKVRHLWDVFNYKLINWSHNRYMKNLKKKSDAAFRKYYEDCKKADFYMEDFEDYEREHGIVR